MSMYSSMTPDLDEEAEKSRTTTPRGHFRSGGEGEHVNLPSWAAQSQTGHKLGRVEDDPHYWGGVDEDLTPEQREAFARYERVRERMTPEQREEAAAKARQGKSSQTERAFQAHLDRMAGREQGREPQKNPRHGGADGIGEGIAQERAKDGIARGIAEGLRENEPEPRLSRNALADEQRRQDERESILSGLSLPGRDTFARSGFGDLKANTAAYLEAQTRREQIAERAREKAARPDATKQAKDRAIDAQGRLEYGEAARDATEKRRFTDTLRDIGAGGDALDKARKSAEEAERKADRIKELHDGFRQRDSRAFPELPTRGAESTKDDYMTARDRKADDLRQGLADHQAREAQQKTEERGVTR